MLSNTRVAIISVVLIGAIIFLSFLDKGMSVPIKRPLKTFPRQIGEWSFVHSRSLSQQVEEKLGVDAYLEYDYVSPAREIVNLYVSYFSSMEGKGFHSPRNCMPGAGWDVASLKPLVLQVNYSESTPVEINNMILQKGADRQVVLYWYQCRGRFIRSEYWEKIYQVLDSIFKRRTDGSFIRIMAPAKDGNTEQTTQHLADFTKEVIPILDDFLPGS
ncbi:MAG: EpsI family protein [Deltaproteobacteria bacterium]|nr:EpsI family protein [Deltaproteobacteria bacterium]